MYRQQAERLAEKLGTQRRDLSVEIYQDGVKGRNWLVRSYDPTSAQTLVFETESEAMGAMKKEVHGRSASAERRLPLPHRP